MDDDMPHLLLWTGMAASVGLCVWAVRALKRGGHLASRGSVCRFGAAWAMIAAALGATLLAKEFIYSGPPSGQDSATQHGSPLLTPRAACAAITLMSFSSLPAAAFAAARNERNARLNSKSKARSQRDSGTPD
jgi:hypothetical protein